ncbi:MAG: hypothetical protein N2449_01395 [Bacteroidales bacterium]|nr:hypothetical protein [Bacteroidales bacterium]
MKWVLIISFCFFTVEIYSQQQDKIALFVNQKLYKKFKNTDTSSFSKWIQEFAQKKILLLDSVVYRDNRIHYYTSLPTKQPFTLVITDTANKPVLVKKRIYKHQALYYMFSVISDAENNGYPFANLKLDSILLRNSSWHVQYTLNFGNRFTYDSLDIIGKQIVHKNFLQAYLNIKPGNIYREKEIRQMDKWLYQIPFLKINRKTDIFFVNDKAKCRIYLEKNNANQFNGIVGIGTLPDNTVSISGDVHVVMNNLFKMADSWEVQWKKNEALSQQLHAQASLPYLFYQPIGVSGLFSIQKQDTTYVNFRYKAGLNIYTTGFNGLMLFYEQRKTFLIGRLASDIAPVTTRYAGILFNHKNTDRIWLPTKGYQLTATMAYGKKSLQKQWNDSVGLIISKNDKPYLITFNGVCFIPILRWFTAKISAEGGIQQPVHFRNELFRVGGSKSIRGFDEESFWAQKYGLSSLEGRFILDRNTQLFLFYDKMMYRSLNRTTDYPWSVGAGAELNTTAGVFFISYALGSQLHQPLDFKTAKIHFGYKNLF